MKISMIDLKAKRLQEMVDDRTKELKHEVEKRKRIELEVAKLERLNVIGHGSCLRLLCKQKPP